MIVLPPVQTPTLRHTFRRLRRSLARLDPAFRRDLQVVTAAPTPSNAAGPARIGAAGLTAGTYALDPDQPDRFVDPTTAVLLLRGETTWPALAAIAATCFDALHDTPSWNEDDDQGAAIEAFNDALDARSPRWPAGRGPATAPTPRPAWWSLASSSGCSPDCSATRTPSVTGRTAGGSGMPTPPDRSASRSAGAVRPVGLRLTWHRHGGGLPDGEPGTVAVAGRELPGVLPAGIPAATLSRWAATTPTATPACRRRSPTWPPPAGRAPTPPSRTPHTRRDSAVRSTDTDRDHPAVPTLEPPTCRPGEQDHFRSTFQLGDVVRMPDGALGRITAFDTTWSHVRAG